jgi:hypothetical protein
MAPKCLLPIHPKELTKIIKFFCKFNGSNFAKITKWPQAFPIGSLEKFYKDYVVAKFVHVHCNQLATNALLNCIILQLLDFANGIMLQLESINLVLNCNLLNFG